MTTIKGLSLSAAAAAAAVLLCGAQAQQPTDLQSRPALPHAGTQASVGIGVICNTSQQAEQYVSLRAHGQAITPAMTTVNRRAKQPRACGIAAIAYIRGRTLDSKPINGKLVQIVRVSVIAGYNGVTWHQIANTTQYAVIETKGIVI